MSGAQADAAVDAEGATEGTVAVDRSDGGRSLSDELYRAALPIWEAQLDDPFVRGLADGSLAEERFRRWVEQDYLYLKEFARVFAWAAAKAERLESMEWYATVLDLTLNTEMELHRGYAARFGLTPEQLEAVEMWPTTRAYTDFLVRTSADGDMLDLLAALLPCAWGYLWIARRMKEGGLPDDPRYADWIDMYTSDDFAQAASWLRAEMDRLGASVGAEKQQRLQEIFDVSSLYEARFWRMCWAGETW